jgi:hypothetical protein
LSQTVVFVDLGGFDEHPQFWIAPDWWVKDSIFKAHPLAIHDFCQL